VSTDLALGFRVKSGFAIAVGLAGSAAEPMLIARRIVELSDPNVPQTKQPFHAGAGTAQEDPKEIARLTKIIARSALRSVEALLGDELFVGRRCRAALVVGSVIDPARVGNLHIRAHASEGRLFRTVLEAALKEHGVPCSVVVEKSLGAQAAKGIGRPQGQIKKVVGRLGDALGGPWRAEEKAAATAAWMVL
jgi:hypothetical protein